MVDEEDPGKRRLTRAEAVGLLSHPLVGVFSSLSSEGWIHSVPVHFLYAGDRVSFLAGARDVKTHNVERTGHGTLCVEVTEGKTRSFVSVSGPALVRRPPGAPELRALDQRYGRGDFAAAGDHESTVAEAVMIVISADRWIAWADWD